jgi:hypothetical protein
MNEKGQVQNSLSAKTKEIIHAMLCSVIKYVKKNEYFSLRTFCLWFLSKSLQQLFLNFNDQFVGYHESQISL